MCGNEKLRQWYYGAKGAGERQKQNPSQHTLSRGFAQ
ncbi:protein of unknown function (plasmid) [Cupriavidus taiwanensis]|nr:protein of unknown function [Cupriavidus taiwanensis]